MLPSIPSLRRPGALLLLLAASACSFNRSYVNPDCRDLPKRMSQVKKGETTVNELEEILGAKPQSTMRTPTGELVLVYTYGEVKSSGLTLIVLNLSRANSAIDTALFFIDAQNIVQDYSVGDASRRLEWEWWPFGN
jgi:hypothetical protein